MDMIRLLSAILLTFAASLHAEIALLPEVHVPAWKATDVVIVTEGEVTDGNVEVLETWKGDLARGARISVPALAAFAGEQKVSGERILLYLIRDGGEWLFADGMQASVAWIANGTVFVMEARPISGLVLNISSTESGWKAWTNEALAAQRALGEAMAEEDPAAIADAVPALFATGSGDIAEAVLAALGEAGPKAVPALRRVLADDRLGWHSREAIRVLVKAAGGTAAIELAELLEDDLAFWRGAVTTLKSDWPTDAGMPESQRSRLQTRYLRLEAALAALRDAGTNVAGRTVAEICELWQSSPQLQGEQLEPCAVE
jgi:hypothetical protein